MRVLMAICFFLIASALQAAEVRIFYSGSLKRPIPPIVQVGDRVMIFNFTKEPHQFISTTPGFEFQTTRLKGQEHHTVVFFKPGRFTFYCPQHPESKVDVIVKE